jgi:catalase
LADGIPCEAPASLTEDYHIQGKVVRQKIRLTDDFERAGQRYRSLSKVDQDHLVDNIADSLGKANKQIQLRMVANLTKSDSKLGKRVAKALKP